MAFLRTRIYDAGKQGPKRVFSGQFCRRIAREPVDLDATQQTAVLEYKYPGWFIVWTENKFAEDVYAWGRRVTALDLEIDGPTAARTAPWRYLCLFELFENSRAFGSPCSCIQRARDISDADNGRFCSRVFMES